MMTNFRPIEWATFTYLAWLNTLLVLYRENLASWFVFFAIHLGIGAAMAGLAYLSAQLAERTVMTQVRLWYPVLLFIVFFEEIGYLVHLVWPGWFDHYLIALDFALWGAHPTLWLERWINPVLNELMQAAYLSYFFLLPSLGLLLQWRRKSNEVELLITATALAYYVCYVIFIAFPIESPHHSLAALQQVPQLEGPLFSRLINWVESFGRVHGGAFPSAHVAGSTVVLLVAWRYARRAFWIYLPIVLALCAATVYGRYHYFIDVPAGVIVAFIGVWAAERCVNSRFAHTIAPCLRSS